MQGETNRYDFSRKAELKLTSNYAAETRLRRVEGRHNPLLKEVRKAFAHAQCTEDGYCAIEGLHIVEEAVRSGLKFRAALFSDSAATLAKRLLPQFGAHVETAILPDKIFAGVVPSETPQGVAALVRFKAFNLEDVLSRAQAGALVAIAGVQDPGNLGTILRSAEAFEAGGILLGEGTASHFNSKTIRASAGSVFRLPIVKTALTENLRARLGQGIRLIATSSHKGTALPDAKLTGPLAIFVGNEGSGLSRDLLRQMDEIVVIPHSSKVESLNAGVAASLVLYEAARQRDF